MRFPGVTEEDCRKALFIAKLLEVELEPWQETLLQVMLASHRQEVDGPLCGMISPTSGSRCTRFQGHTVNPLEPSHLGEYGWF